MEIIEVTNRKLLKEFGTMNIGIIGLGRMGASIARRLMRAGNGSAAKGLQVLAKFGPAF